MTDAYKLKELAAFDPKRLAKVLQNLPDGALVVGLEAWGPTVALPLPRGDPIVGGFYYHDQTVDVWTGSGYQVLARLIEWDGKPMLVKEAP